MEDIIEGTAYVLGDDIDTDQIIPAEHLVYSLSDPEEKKNYGKYALSGVPSAGAGLPDGGKSFIAEGRFESDHKIIVDSARYWRVYFGWNLHVPDIFLEFSRRVDSHTRYGGILCKRQRAVQSGGNMCGIGLRPYSDNLSLRLRFFRTHARISKAHPLVFIYRSGRRCVDRSDRKRPESAIGWRRNGFGNGWQLNLYNAE
jgi:hypothetical protein